MCGAYTGFSLVMELFRLRRELTEACMAKRLSACGFPTSTAEYTAIENGAPPQDSRAFLRALTMCLDLTHDELEVLINLLALALLTEKVGADLARQSLHKPISIPTPPTST
jgi:hypothetical protein